MSGTRGRPVIALLTFAVWAFITAFLGRLLNLTHGLSSLTEAVEPSYVIAIVFLLATVAAFRWRDVGLAPPRPARSLLLLWFPGLYVAAFLALLLRIGFPPAPVTLAIFANAMLAGVSEELACRGVLFAGLRSRISAWSAILISTALFAAGHLLNGFAIHNFALAGVQSIAAFMTGIAFMAIRLRTGSLYPGMVLHGLWDFSLLCLASGMLQQLEQSDGAVSGLTAGALMLPLVGVLPNFLYGLYLLRRVGHDKAGTPSTARPAAAPSLPVDALPPSAS